MFVIEGDPGTITVIDPRTDSAVAIIKAGEKMAYATAGEAGTVYVAGNEKKDGLDDRGFSTRSGSASAQQSTARHPDVLVGEDLRHHGR